ncbi:MAG: DNA polymerase III subunit gamma/tau [Planctomycetes bacterium]|nr:DNA polymerase III subunit gamma/tau [Planctomycetota bacterium]
MAYLAMSRRYRPATFDEVVGQEHVAKTLKNAITSGRVAHAYLFCGPHGVGKTSMARIFAKALNCTGGPSAELPADCPICKDITNGNDTDVMEIDGASNNGVEQVRSLREHTGYVPSRARFKIYIIDEVHMLSVPAFNALLKTLEEPPPHVKFILATTEPHKLLDTVLSRCQRFDFRLIPVPVITQSLYALCQKEDIKITDDAIEAIAAFASGSMRDALVLLDQLTSYCLDGVTREDVERVRGVAGVESVVNLFNAITSQDCQAALKTVDEVSRRGTGAGDFLEQLITYGRDLMLYITTKNEENLSGYGPAREAVKRHAEAVSIEQALLILDIFTTARTRVRSRVLSNPQVPLEMAVVRLAGLEGIESVGKAIARLEALAAGGSLVEAASAPNAEKKTPHFEIPIEKPAKTPQAEPQQLQLETVANAVEASSYPYKSPEPPPITETGSEPRAVAEGGNNLTLEFLQESWPQVLEAIHENYPPDRAYFQDIKPVSVEDNTLVLELPPGGIFIQEQFEDRDRRNRVIACLSQALQRSVNFRMIIAKDGSRENPAQESARSRKDALQDPIVQMVMEKFKGELLNIE